MLITIILFLIVFSVLVLVHELGHFLAAKVAGVRVEEFGIGFPPRLRKLLQRGDTEYTINWLPFGAFVRVAGEDETRPSQDPRAFPSQPARVKFIIVVAGAVMNVLLAYLLTVVVVARFGQPIMRQAALVVEVMPDTPAQEAGLYKDDLIYAAGVAGVQIDQVGLSAQAGRLDAETAARVEGQREPLTTDEAFIDFVKSQAGNFILLWVERQEEVHCVRAPCSPVTTHLVVAIKPRPNPPPGQGLLGIRFGIGPQIIYKPISLRLVPEVAARHEINLIYLMMGSLREMVANLVFHGILPQQVTGPVGLAQITGEVAREGIFEILNLMAIVSINLAVINLLPLPALDGGRLLMIVAEGISGRTIPPLVHRAVHSAGFAILLILMIAITIYDIVRIF